jgi:hypothetical protein
MNMEILRRSYRRILLLAVLVFGAGIALAVVWGTVHSGDFTQNFRTASVILGVPLFVPGGGRLALGGLGAPHSGPVLGFEHPAIREAGGDGGEPAAVNAIGLAAAGLLLVALGIVV